MLIMPEIKNRRRAIFLKLSMDWSILAVEENPCRYTLLLWQNAAFLSVMGCKLTSGGILKWGGRDYTKSRMIFRTFFRRYV